MIFLRGQTSMSEPIVKLRTNKKPNANGAYPVAIYFFKGGKETYLHIGHRITVDDWDDEKQRVRKSHPNSVRLNNLIKKRLSEVSDAKIQLETERPHVSGKAIKNKIKPKIGATFFPVAEDRLNDLKKAGKYNQYAPDKPRIQHFRDFLDGSDIAFADITPGLLEKFAVWLKYTYKPKGKKITRLSDRSIVNHWVTIRSVFTHARRNGVIKKGETPFGEDGIKIEFPDSLKIPLSAEELDTLENLTLPTPRHEHARKLWLFSLYFAGMRASDLLQLKWSDFQNYRLYYKMGKNNKGGSLKIPDPAVGILKHYEQFKERDDDFIFPDLKGLDLSDKFTAQRIIGNKISAIDKILNEHVAPAAGITKKMTLHIARHTFGDMAGDTIQTEELQGLYRHSSPKTTKGYQQNFIHKQSDNALDAVLANRKKAAEPNPTEKLQAEAKENFDQEDSQPENTSKPKQGLVVAFRRDPHKSSGPTG